VTITSWQLAKRELHAVLTSRNIWVGATAAGLVLGFAAPFGTDAYLGLFARLLYWTAVVQITLLTGTLIATLLNPTSDQPPRRRWGGVTATGVLIGACVSVEVLMLNWLVFGQSPFAPAYALSLALNAVAISVIVNLSASWFGDRPSAATADRTQTTEDDIAPPLLSRLPLDKRGKLISLSVQDHYVEVTTTSGRDVLLLRLSDAIREAGDGFQIHRSHWVASDAITRVVRAGSAARLTTTDGRELPVSRTYVPELRQRGLLP